MIFFFFFWWVQRVFLGSRRSRRLC
uniref:Uncharacterized protein MANES_11G024900 n=1 Tax=Rhizophora mucronata TaxID=61149 RepID=A0A2P2QVF7_RHIMU